ncbi:MAG: polysaccharide polymerase, partial [Bacteroidota bacterium]
MPKNQPKKNTASSKNQLPNQLIIAYVFLLLYSISCFVPLFNAMDYDAPRWLYMSLVNMGALLFIFKNNDFFQAFQLGKKARIYLFALVGFFVAGCISMIVAINVSESLVHLARFVNVIIAFFCVFTFVRKDPTSFFTLACRVAAILVIFYGWKALYYFIGNSGIARTDEFVTAFQNGFSNINIYSAFLVIQIPFLMYGIIYFYKWWKYISGIAFVIGL